MSAQSGTELRTLTPEQQKAIAEIELQEFRRRERLNGQARGYTGKRWVTLVLLVLALWVVGKNGEFPYRVIAFTLIGIYFTLLHVHINGINRRLDALLALREGQADGADKDKPVQDDKKAA